MNMFIGKHLLRILHKDDNKEGFNNRLVIMITRNGDNFDSLQQESHQIPRQSLTD